jgi:large subunit ribosomal protein L4
MINIDVVDKNNKKIEVLELNEKIFNSRVNSFLLQQAVNMYLANQRKSFANVKTRGEVRGGGKKPWRQKGTGRARVGSIRSPLWRGGGVTFGPVTKDWHYQLPKKIKKQALVSSINSKINEGNMVVVDKLVCDSGKSKDMAGILNNLKMNTAKVMIITENPETNILRAGRNIRNLDIVRAEDVNAYDVLVNDKIIFEKGALQKLEKRLSRDKVQKRQKRVIKNKVA